MPDFEYWGCTRISFCEACGVSLKTFRNWRRWLGLVPRNWVGRPDGFVEPAVSSGPVRDIELSLGDGVVLRVRHS